MKPHRAGKKHRSNRPAKQVLPKPKRTITIAIFNADTGFYCDPLDIKSCGLEDQIEIPEPLFKKVKAGCKEFGITLEHFFKQAIQEKINRAITVDAMNKALMAKESGVAA